MVVIRFLWATACFPFLHAIIVDSHYTPSQNKEQIQAFQPIKPHRPAENPNRETYHSKEAPSEPYVKPLYKYGYSVLDPYTLDVKSHWEHRDGDFVKGAYNMLEADGSMRIVEYVSDKDTGFRAVVKKIPHYFKNERGSDAFPLPKSNRFPEQFFTPPKPAPPPAPYQQGHDKGHLQNLHDNPIRVYDDRPFTPVRQFDERPSSPIREHNDRPFNPVRQFDERPPNPVRQHDDRPFSPVRQFEDRPPNPIRQYDDRPFGPARQMEDRPPPNKNYMQRDNYYKSYQTKPKKQQQPVLKYRPLISTG